MVWYRGVVDIIDMNVVHRGLSDIQQNQAAKRSILHRAMEIGEFEHCKALARLAFGARAYMEYDSIETGMIYIGYYTDGPAPQVPTAARLQYCKRVMWGNSHKELIEQYDYLRKRLG